MQIHLHQTHHTVADFNEIEKYIQDHFKSEEKLTGLHLFPELFLTGYPLQDLCLQKPFVIKYQELLKRINKFSKDVLSKKYKEDELCLLMGGIHYELTENGIPFSLKNVIFKLTPGKELEAVYTKRLLPNYDIFDEQKYFTAGESPKTINFQSKEIGLLICEDMWASSFHKLDPCEDLKNHLKKEKINLDVVVNLSASPFFVGKDSKRKERGMEISRFLDAPFVYLNRVGGEDEILFDGHSFICDGKNTYLEFARFQKDYQVYKLDENTYSFEGKKELGIEYTWEGLFNARMSAKSKIPTLKPWTDDEAKSVLDALIFGFREYSQKNGFNSFTIALSGGIDSTLVLTIIRLALLEGQKLEAIYMPSIHSSPLSHDLSLKLCQNLGVPLSTMPIKFLHSTAKNLFMQTYSNTPFDGLADENIQSRIRGMLLYARSNQIGSMVVNTSNKSEIAVGYSTQYGDSVGAISLLGDLFKTEVYRLCEYINQKYENAIPNEIINREPSAELRPDQLDSQSLPPYERLDAILEGILSYRFDKNDLIGAGFSEEEVVKVFNLYRKTEYKRSQFCPIIKVATKSFGFGYRVPMSKKSEFYT